MRIEVRHLAFIGLLLWAWTLLGCEGSGSNGGGLEIGNEIIAEGCTPAAGSFPPGLAVLSEAVGRAAIVQLAPAGVFVYGIDSPRPTAIAFRNIGTDSDSDGFDDATANATFFGFPLGPVMGEITAIADDLAFVSTSNYEQVLTVNPSDASARTITVDVPASIPADRFPLLPPPGMSAPRTGLSTLACIYPPSAIDSTGAAIPAHPACLPSTPSYLTSLTAGKVIAGGRLFVATSNLRIGTRYNPGTVLVFDWVPSGSSFIARPAATNGVLFTTGFNPTGIARVVTPGGRELVLVTVTGAIGSGSGAGNLFTDSAVDVIDPAVPRVVARIPLGFAGPSFGAPAVDPTGTAALLGASSQRRLFGVDLRALDNPALYTGTGPPVVLDGMTVGSDDARIFTADNPLEIPPRTDRPSGPACEGLTEVAFNFAGSEAFVTDFCDGTLTRIRIDLSGSPAIPIPRNRFQVASQSAPFAPSTALGELSAPGMIATRRGIPGVDFDTPDVLVIAGQPTAQLCAFRIESF